MFYIYTLSNPLTKEIRYIGKTNNLKKRFTSHICDKGKSKKVSWIKSLRNKGLSPIMEILEEFDNEEDCLASEEFWIQQFKGWEFNLTNLAQGGIGGYVGIGEKNFNAKLSESEVIFICEEIMLGKHYSQIDLPKLTKSIFAGIRQKTSWIHITSKYNFPPITYEYRSKPTRIRPIIDKESGIEYQSIREASKNVGKTEASLYHLLSKKNFARFEYI